MNQYHWAYFSGCCLFAVVGTEGLVTVLYPVVVVVVVVRMFYAHPTILIGQIDDYTYPVSPTLFVEKGSIDYNIQHREY